MVVVERWGQIPPPKTYLELIATFCTIFYGRKSPPPFASLCVYIRFFPPKNSVENVANNEKWIFGCYLL